MVTFIKNYKTEDDIETDNIKLGTEFYLSDYAEGKIENDGLNFPFFVYEDENNDNWILEKQDVENKTFEEFNDEYSYNDMTKEDIKKLYNKANELYFGEK